MMKNAKFYQVLYSFLLFSFTVFEYIFNGLITFIKVLQTICHELESTSKRNKRLQTKLIKLNKKPKHITVLLGAEEFILKDLANVIIYCLATQISFISFYDYKGNLKKYEEELQYEVSQIKGKNDHIIWHKDDNRETIQKNGFIGSRIHVKILSDEDGRKGMVSLVRQLATTKNRNINIEKINEHLVTQYEFPDPELGLVCGNIFCFYGYPPWQIRLTEFIKLQSLRELTLSVFVDLLVKYGKCEQRLGK